MKTIQPGLMLLITNEVGRIHRNIRFAEHVMNTLRRYNVAHLQCDSNLNGLHRLSIFSNLTRGLPVRAYDLYAPRKRISSTIGMGNTNTPAHNVS